MSGTTTPPAGWYNDPNQPDMARYWDGSSWTHKTQPIPESVVVSAEPAPTALVPASMAVEKAPPPWAAEVVEAEAATFEDPAPWWQTKQLLIPLALLGAVVLGFVLLPLTGDSTTATSASNADDQARAVGEGTVETAPPETADAETQDVETTQTLEAEPAEPETPPDAVDAGETAAPDDDAVDATTTTPEELPEAAPAIDDAETDPDTPETTTEPTTTTAAPTTTTAAPTTAAPTTTEAPTAPLVDVPAGISAPCLNAVQAAVDAAGGDETPEDLHASFSECPTETEWQLASDFTGLGVRLDTSAWVTNECIADADLFALPLCVSAIDPNSGPRRIDCGDGREDIEWPAVDDNRTNGEVCADHFQIVCPDGLVHNIPNEALPESEAAAILCA